MSTTINRKPLRFKSYPNRVIARFFLPGGAQRVQSVIQKVIDMPDEAALLSLNQSIRDFSGRHSDISKIYQKHYDRITETLKETNDNFNSLSEAKKLLIGAYFTSEYSIESAAFFNPSMVEAPDQKGLQKGQKRVIISFRASGENNISSIVFRGGILNEHNKLEIEPVGSLVEKAGKTRNNIYKKDDFILKLGNINDESDVNIENGLSNQVLDKLQDEFDYNEISYALEETKREIQPNDQQNKILETIKSLANSHYEVVFSSNINISDRNIYPFATDEINGMEDARFVRFTDDNGKVRYYATYSANNGVSITPKLLETNDFCKFKISPLCGTNMQSKGMALFPRKINGKYAMLTSLDGVNNYIMYSQDIRIWNDAAIIQKPKFPWELIKVGNSGAPIETEYGWLVLTNGVGMMRKYVIGAILLDLNDPTKIIGQLNEPLLTPNEEEKEGFIPNVVFSCGSIINKDELVIPYAMSDTSSTYATVSLKELLTNLIPSDIEKGSLRKKITKARILIVEDEVINQKMIAAILKSEGYEVEIAPDGIIALMKIGVEPFDVIISDIAMPNLDGYQMLEFMNKHSYHTPLIFLTGNTSVADEMKGLALGAVDYIKKPIDRIVLLESLKKILQSQEN